MLIVILINSFKISFSQESSIYEDYYLNPFIINPAITGAENYPVVNSSVRNQWLDFPGAPSTYLISANYRPGSYDFYDPKGFVNKGSLKLSDRVGLGAALFRDNNGPLSYTGALLSYAYHVPVNRYSRLSFGMSVIGGLYSMNSSMLKPDQMNDSYLFSGNGNIYRANVNLGVYYHNNTYFAGLSGNKILPDVTNVNTQMKEQPSIFIMGGYKFLKRKNNFNIEPSLTIKKIGNNNISVDLHGKLYIQRLNWIAVSYSTTGEINIQFGLRIYRMLYVGYNYEYTLGGIAAYNFGSQEICLGINLGLFGIESLRESIINMDNFK